MRRELDEIADSIGHVADAYDRNEPVIGNGMLVSLVEISEITKIRHSTLRSLRHRGQLPLPIAELAIGPVWLRKDIVNWNTRRRNAPPEFLKKGAS